MKAIPLVGPVSINLYGIREIKAAIESIKLFERKQEYNIPLFHNNNFINNSS